MFIYQIELSNLCSLKCSYCPHPTQQRERGLMTFDTFAKCVEFHRKNSKLRPLILHHFGEPTLHPQLKDFIAYSAAQGVECSFSTNGMRNISQPYPAEFWAELSSAGLKTVNFSAHALPVEAFIELAGEHVHIRRFFIPELVTLGTWAGQVGPPASPTKEPCIFERHEAFVVLWDGRLARCSMDSEAKESQLTIDDMLDGKRFPFRRIALCEACDSMREAEDI